MAGELAPAPDVDDEPIATIVSGRPAASRWQRAAAEIKPRQIGREPWQAACCVQASPRRSVAGIANHHPGPARRSIAPVRKCRTSGRTFIAACLSSALKACGLDDLRRQRAANTVMHRFATLMSLVAA